MKTSPFPPCALHLFVCTHTRSPESGMPCCADAQGEETFAALKDRVLRAGLGNAVWVTRTGCLGFCNADGATVAAYPEGRFFISVEPEDAPAVLAQALASARR